MPTTISSVTASLFAGRAVVRDSSGNLITIDDGGWPYISSDDGATWTQGDTNLNLRNDNADIEIDSADRIHVGHRAFANSGSVSSAAGAYLQFQIASGGTVSGLVEEQVASDATVDEFYASVALAGDGTVYVAHRVANRVMGSDYQHHALFERTGADTWTNHGVITAPTAHTTSSSMVVDGSGTLHFVALGSTELNYQTFDHAAKTFGSAETVSSTSLPQLALDTDGIPLIVANDTLWKRSGGTWSSEVFAPTDPPHEYSRCSIGGSEIQVFWLNHSNSISDEGTRLFWKSGTFGSLNGATRTTIVDHSGTSVGLGNLHVRWQERDNPSTSTVDLTYESTADGYVHAQETITGSATVTASATAATASPTTASVTGVIPGTLTDTTTASSVASHTRQLVRTSTGTLYAVASNGTTHDLFKSTDEGDSWTALGLVGGDDAVPADITVDSTDTLHVLARSNASTSEIHYTQVDTSTDTETVSGEVVYSSGDGVSRAVGAISSTDTFYAVVQFGAKNMGSVSQNLSLLRRDGAATWTDLGALASGTTDSEVPSVAIDSADNLHCAYRSGTDQLVADRYDTTAGAFDGPSSVTTSATDSSFVPSATVTATDDIAVAGSSSNASDSAIWVYDGASWSSPAYSTTSSAGATIAKGGTDYYVVSERADDIYENHAATPADFSTASEAVVTSAAGILTTPTARWQFVNENDPSPEVVEFLYLDTTAGSLLYDSIPISAGTTTTVTATAASATGTPSTATTVRPASVTATPASATGTPTTAGTVRPVSATAAATSATVSPAAATTRRPGETTATAATATASPTAALTAGTHSVGVSPTAATVTPTTAAIAGTGSATVTATPASATASPTTAGTVRPGSVTASPTTGTASPASATVIAEATVAVTVTPTAATGTPATAGTVRPGSVTVSPAAALVSPTTAGTVRPGSVTVSPTTGTGTPTTAGTVRPGSVTATAQSATVAPTAATASGETAVTATAAPAGATASPTTAGTLGAWTASPAATSASASPVTATLSVSVGVSPTASTVGPTAATPSGTHVIVGTAPSATVTPAAAVTVGAASITATPGSATGSPVGAVGLGVGVPVTASPASATVTPSQGRTVVPSVRWDEQTYAAIHDSVMSAEVESAFRGAAVRASTVEAETVASQRVGDIHDRRTSAAAMSVRPAYAVVSVSTTTADVEPSTRAAGVTSERREAEVEAAYRAAEVGASRRRAEFEDE